MGETNIKATANSNLHTNIAGQPTSYVIPTLDHNHSLYLQPNHTPGSSLISLQQTGSENYAIWSRSMRIGLVGKSKLGFIDGRFPKSKFAPELFDIWEKCNAVILSLIMNAVRPGLLSNVVYYGDSHRVWCDIKERFDKINGVHVFQLHKEIHSLTHGTMTVTDYYTTLKGLWNEYDSIMPCPRCSCACSCAESKMFQDHYEYERLLEFLMGLNETYVAARGQILMQTPTPNLNKAFSIIMDHESQRNLAHISSDGLLPRIMESFALPSQKGGNGPIMSANFGHQSGGGGGGARGGQYDNQYNPQKPQRSVVLCKVCGFRGHIKEQCFKVKGYPIGWRSKRKTGGSNSYANNAEVTQSASHQNTGGSTGDNVPTSLATFFTQDQYKQILNLLTKGSETGGDQSTNGEHAAQAAATGKILARLVSNYSSENG